MKYFVVRLNDGETWTNAEDCNILVFDEEPTDEMVKNPGMDNVLARIDEDKAGHFRDGNAGVVINTWKNTKRIELVEVWDP